jgi:hypothetical protein
MSNPINLDWLFIRDWIAPVFGSQISESMKNLQYKMLSLSILLVVMPLYTADADVFSDTFPVYDSIRPNVSFWKKIYTEYSTTQGVIHDKRKLGIIYGVIDLKDRNRHGSKKINRNRIKKAKKKYKLILDKLARGETPIGPEEQRVAGLFGAHAHHPIRCLPGRNYTDFPRLRFAGGFSLSAPCGILF